jgi:putative flippase GtrA
MKIMPEAEAPSAQDKTAAGPRSAPDKAGTAPPGERARTGAGPTGTRAAGERYVALMAAIVRRLPFGLDRVAAPNLLGFAVINLCTFSLDLALLTALHGGLGWPVPVSITLSYVTASGVSYVLNRSLNFRSHGALGTQASIYAVVITVNYLAWILGVGAGLAALGVNYQLARVAAGLCEAAYMYVAMRWLVFRDTRARG